VTENAHDPDGRVSNGAKGRYDLSRPEFERLVSLFPYPHHWTNEHGLGAEARAALMANNTPAVAWTWLREKGLLDA
jgi:hypothetical protein